MKNKTWLGFAVFWAGLLVFDTVFFIYDLSKKDFGFAILMLGLMAWAAYMMTNNLARWRDG